MAEVMFMLLSDFLLNTSAAKLSKSDILIKRIIP